MPVVSDEDAVFAKAEGQGADSLDGSFVEQSKALGVVDVVGARLGAVQHRAGLAPDLSRGEMRHSRHQFHDTHSCRGTEHSYKKTHL